MSNKNPLRFFTVVILLLSAVFAAPLAAQTRDEAVVMRVTANGVAFEPNVEFDRLTLVVAAPDGKVFRREFAAGETPFFNFADGLRADGQYVYEIRLTTANDKSDAAATPGDNPNNGRIAGAISPRRETVQSGAFSVAGGAVVPPGQSEAEKTAAPRRSETPRPNDVVVPDDQIVQGSLCVGFDCVNNESFGFDTVRLKENNLRIKFEDTSVGNFPTVDWQLTANDSASGGADRFSIEDVTNATIPFTVRAAAPTNSFFVDNIGRVGFRTATPVLDAHFLTTNTPAIRLDQSNAGGFFAQTWDIAGNEANFFVRDVTNGSRLPFRIRPGAPTSSLDIAASGNVGIGTASPGSRIDVVGASADAAGSALRLRNSNNVELLFVNNVGQVGIGTTAPFAELDVRGNAFIKGDLTITGSIIQQTSASGDGAVVVNAAPQFAELRRQLAEKEAQIKNLAAQNAALEARQKELTRRLEAIEKLLSEEKK